MQAGVPIVPVVIHNSGDVQPKGDLLYHPGTVKVEVLSNAAVVARGLGDRGYEVAVDGRRLVVGPGDHTIETAVVEEAARAGSGLVRMVRGTSSLEDLFLHKDVS